MAYLDDKGLEYLWSKFKTYVDERPGTSAAPIITITLAADGWTDNQQTVEASGVLADETKQVIQPMPAAANQQAYYDAGIMCTGQGVDSLTFSADTVPVEDLTVYVAVTSVGVVQEPIVTYKWWSPKQTSNTSPYSVSSNSTTYGTVYGAFDNNTSTCWHGIYQNAPAWIMIDFGDKKSIYGLRMRSRNEYPDQLPSSFSIQGSDDNVNYTDLVTKTDLLLIENLDWRECMFNEIVNYRYYRIFITKSIFGEQSPGKNVAIGDIEFAVPD